MKDLDIENEDSEKPVKIVTFKNRKKFYIFDFANYDYDVDIESFDKNSDELIEE